MKRVIVTNKPLKTTSTIDKDIMLNNSPMKFNVPGKLVVPRIYDLTEGNDQAAINEKEIREL